MRKYKSKVLIGKADPAQKLQILMYSGAKFLCFGMHFLWDTPHFAYNINII